MVKLIGGRLQCIISHPQAGTGILDASGVLTLWHDYCSHHLKCSYFKWEVLFDHDYNWRDPVSCKGCTNSQHLAVGVHAMRRRHSSASRPFTFRSPAECQWSLYLVHIRKMRLLLLTRVMAAAVAARVMYAGVNGPTVTEHPSVGQSTSPDRQAGPAMRRRWRPPTDAASAAAGRPSHGSTRPSTPRPCAVDGPRSSGRARAPARPIHDTLNEATKLPFATTSGLLYDEEDSCRWQNKNAGTVLE